MRACLTALLVAAGSPAAAFSYPDGAPWGHAGVDGGETCVSCHFDHDTVPDSDRITLDGLPDHYVPGQTYRLVVRLDATAPDNGFQLAASAGDHAAGRFAAADTSTDAECAAVRSVSPGHTWPVDWTAPDRPGLTIRFWMAANFANGDASQFGDRIHLRSFELND